MKKLSKAQEKALDRIKNLSQKEMVELRIRQLENLKVEDAKKWGEYAEERIKRYRNGWVSIHSTNSRTFEILAENGYIQYEKDNFRQSFPIDWVKLI